MGGRPELPDFCQVRQALTIVFQADAAARAKFFKNRHHLAHREAGDFGGATR